MYIICANISLFVGTFCKNILCLNISKEILRKYIMNISFFFELFILVIFYTKYKKSLIII